MEKRFYPRIVNEFSAVVENEEGLQLKVQGVDASGDGICVQCNTYERNLITPGGSFVRNGKPVELFVWMEFPFGQNQSERIGARCHVAFSRRISSDQCKIGMRYVDLDEEKYDMLMQYFASVSTQAVNDSA